MEKKRIYQFTAFLAAFLVLLMGVGTLTAFADGSSVMERLLEEVSPKITTTLRSGDKLELRALAAQNAEVTARINSTTVNLRQTSDKKGTLIWYEGTYTLPNFSEQTNLGRIEFTARKDGRTETRRGGKIRVVVPSRYENVDKPSGGESGHVDVEAASGDIVRVIEPYAEIYSSVDRGEDYAAPYYYNLPQNTMDYVIGSTKSTYILKSGRRVGKERVEYVKKGTNGDNRISGVSVRTDSDFTTLTVRQDWAVPFNITVSPLSYSGNTNTVTSCMPEKITITFDYTTKAPAGSLHFRTGSAFRSAQWKNRVENGIAKTDLTLELAKKGGYYGAYAEYDTRGTLTLKFLNPVDSLKGARIVIDPGHGTGDTGNTVGMTNEAVVNLRHAKALQKELESRGAKVTMLETRGKDYVGVMERAEMGVEAMPHVFLSVHQNSAPGNPAARGVEVFYNTPYSKRLAKSICDDMYAAYTKMPYGSSARNRGDKFSEFAVTRPKQYASVLIEYGFLSNSMDDEILNNPKYEPDFAKAVADGVDKFFRGE